MRLIKHSPKWWKAYYKAQELLAVNFLEDFSKGSVGDVRSASSLPASLNTTARAMVNALVTAEPVLETIRVSREVFHNQLNSLPADKRVYLDEEVTADKFYNVIEDGVVLGAFGTCRNGYLTGLFGLVKGRGQDVINERVRVSERDADKGIEELDLFCIGEHVRDIYLARGFELEYIVSWDDEYAPIGWDYESKGRPTLYRLTKAI